MNRYRILVVACLLLTLSTAACQRIGLGPARNDASASAPTVPKILPVGDSTGEVSSGGKLRRYRLHVPPSYQSETPLPLVLNLPGRGQSAAQVEALSGMSRAADTAGFVVAYPEALGEPSTWYVGPGGRGSEDVGFIRDLVRSLESGLSVDASRVYATGISNGGGMVNRLGCDASDVFAAIATVSGAYQYAEECRPSRPMPVLAFHGTDDQVVPYEGDGLYVPPVRKWAAGWAARNGCAPTSRESDRVGETFAETWDECSAGVTVTLYTIPYGRHTWPGGLTQLAGVDRGIDATDIIWQFFAQHQLPAS